MTAPKISIIIPIYNAEEHLRGALDSVLSQSLKDIEVICVDDGSTDGSSAILAEYEARDGRVRVYHQKNCHAGAARNLGIAHAAGEYLHFLDADDYVLDYAYEALYSKAIRYRLDVLKFSCLVYDMQRQCFVDDRSMTLSNLRPGDFNRYLDLSADSPIYKVCVAPWNGLYRRSYVTANNLSFNELYCVNDRSFFAAVITNTGAADAAFSVGAQDAARGEDAAGGVGVQDSAGREDADCPRAMMIARDCLVVHRINQGGSSLVDQRAAHFDCHFRNIEIVVEQMAQDDVPIEVQEKILAGEFTDLFGWLRKYYDEPEYGGRIQSDTEAFVRQYRGPFQAAVRRRYREALQKIASHVPKKPFPVMKVYHKSCAKPKVTVVVPTYNVEAYLNEALHSLSAQKLEEMEFLLVNDGSTDGSLTIMKEYAALDRRMRILDGPNGGYGKAMNRGIDAAKGEYLGILEPDDFVPPEMFKTLYDLASGKNLEIVKSNFYRFKVNPDGTLNQKLERLTRQTGYYNRVICPVQEQQVFRFKMNTWSGIYSLKFLNRWHIRHNETPGASYQDNGFWFLTFSRASRLWLVDKAFYMNRRDNPGSSMYDPGKARAITEEYRFIWEKLSADSALSGKLAPVFHAMRFVNFMTTYYRLAPELQEEYLHHIAEEMRPVLEQKLLLQDLMAEVDWQQAHEIAEDPDAFYRNLKVSVIMPVCNAASSLRQALDSLLVRNETQFEVICVDDGSTDASSDILKEYGAKDPRVRVITQERCGVGTARNNGLQHARGGYLSFLDADGVYEPDMLRRAYDHAHLNNADILVFGSDRYAGENGKVPALSDKSRQDGRISAAGEAVHSGVLPSGEPFAGAEIEEDVFRAFQNRTGDKLFRRAFVRENGLHFQEHAGDDDFLFVPSAVIKAERICTYAPVLIHWRKRANELSSGYNKDECDGFCQSLQALRRQLKAWGIYDEREQDYINYCTCSCLWIMNVLRGPAFFQMYGQMTAGGLLDDLGITVQGKARRMDYYYSRSEYQQLQILLASESAEDYLFALREEALRDCAVACGKAESLGSERDRLKKEKSRLQKKLDAIYGSLSWKIGRAATRIPRWLRDHLRGKKR